MQNLEINCNNCDWFNLIYTTELELILMCDSQLMNQVK